MIRAIVGLILFGLISTVTHAEGFRKMEGFSSSRGPLDLSVYGPLLVYYAPTLPDFYVSGAGISKWKDRSGNANDATQATTSLRPNLVLGTLHNFPAAEFDGSDDGLQAGTAISVTQLSVFVVFRTHTVPPAQAPLITTYSGGIAGFTVLVNQNSNIGAQVHNAGGGPGIGAPGTYNTMVWSLAEGHFGPTTYFAALNGAEGSTDTNTFDASAVAPKLAFGDGVFDGDIALVAVFDGQLDATGRANVRSAINNYFHLY